MSTPFETEILAANAKYVSAYTHGGLECPPKKKAVISKFSRIQNLIRALKLTQFPSNLHGLSS
jgi:hypothetical protein